MSGHFDLGTCVLFIIGVFKWDRVGWAVAMSVRRACFSNFENAPSYHIICSGWAGRDRKAELAIPKESSVDNDFWWYVDTIFAALAGADGEEEGNLFWVQRPRETTDLKLVLQASQVRECTVRAMILLLDESPFIGGKVMVSSDTLIILYLRGDFALDQDLLHGIVECCDAVPFLPYNCTTTDPRLIWLGNSNEGDSFCQPIY